jgi:hypothetical protein
MVIADEEKRREVCSDCCRAKAQTELMLHAGTKKAGWDCLGHHQDGRK